MLILGRAVIERCELKNLLVLTLPGGDVVRIWISPGKGANDVQCNIDAPRSVGILRGEIADADDTTPPTLRRE